MAARMGRRLLERAFGVRPDEAGACLLAWAWFFLILGAYYLLRPVRDMLGLRGGSANLPDLYTGTAIGSLILAPFFSTLVRRAPARWLVPLTHGALVLMLSGFAVSFLTLGEDSRLLAGYGFYIWLSVINLLLVSMLWATLSAGFALDASKRLFPFVGVGGTLGAICGAWASGALAGVAPPGVMMALGAGGIALATIPAWLFVRLRVRARPAEGRRTNALADAAAGAALTARSPYLSGFSLYLLLFTAGSTLLYFAQARIVETAAADDAGRVRIFASIDVWTNLATLAMQLFVSSRIIRRIGVGWTLAIVPAVGVIGFAALLSSPTVAVATVFQAARRAANFALSRPARETLFTVVSHDERYAAKTFADTFVYRTGDVITARLAAPLVSAGAIGSLSVAGGIVSVGMGGVGVLLGRMQALRAARQAGAAQASDS